jgi:general stress protein 26
MYIKSQNCFDIPQLIKLIEGKSVGMLTCLDYGGALVSKPITPLEIDNKGAIWFFIDLQAGSIVHLCNANLSFVEMHSETFLSISGSGEINKNQAVIESLWTDSSKTRFPNGPQSINLALLKFSPYAAECWDVSQSKMVSVYTMFASVVPSLSIGKSTSKKININAIKSINRGQTLVANNL